MSKLRNAKNNIKDITIESYFWSLKIDFLSNKIKNVNNRNKDWSILSKNMSHS